MSSQQAPALDRVQILLLALFGLFSAFFIVGDIIGGKLFEFSIFGLVPGHLGLGEGKFVATVGILAFPLTFLLTDIINEYFGKRVVRLFTLLSISVMLLLQLVVQASINATTVSFTPGVSAEQFGAAYSLALGQSWMIVVASTTAFAIGQLLDVKVFGALRRLTGGRMLWLRAQGSTLVSQAIDTVVVIGLAFMILPMLTGGNAWSMSNFLTVCATNYLIKFGIAVASTPILYIVHLAVEQWLGHDTAAKLKSAAHE